MDIAINVAEATSYFDCCTPYPPMAYVCNTHWKKRCAVEVNSYGFSHWRGFLFAYHSNCNDRILQAQPTQLSLKISKLYYSCKEL